jgi:uncharacterized protein YjiS (DUF1127 family)
MSRHSQVYGALPHAAGSSQFAWSTLWFRIERVLEVRRQRRALMALDDRLLKDIGINRTEAWREGSRNLLDLPEENVWPYWLR